jgi:hypothetical protein
MIRCGRLLLDDHEEPPGRNRGTFGQTRSAALSATLTLMPTKKRRYTITADENVEFALRRSRRSFPAGTSDSRILAALVSKGERAIEQENQAAADHEQHRRLAAERLADRFRRPGGLDYAALGEASARWLDG